MVRVRAFIEMDLPLSELEVWSERADVDIYVNTRVRDLVNEADSIDDLPLQWEEI